MRPKEKALELIEKMNVIHYMKLYGEKNKNSKGLPISMHNDQIKGCALIAVDEILFSLYDIDKNLSNFTDYWEEVKQELLRP